MNEITKLKASQINDKVTFQGKQVDLKKGKFYVAEDLRIRFKPNKQWLRIEALNQNIRSLRSNRKQSYVKQLFKSYDSFDSFTYICIQETWLSDDILSAEPTKNADNLSVCRSDRNN